MLSKNSCSLLLRIPHALSTLFLFAYGSAVTPSRRVGIRFTMIQLFAVFRKWSFVIWCLKTQNLQTKITHRRVRALKRGVCAPQMDERLYRYSKLCTQHHIGSCEKLMGQSISIFFSAKAGLMAFQMRGHEIHECWHAGARERVALCLNVWFRGLASALILLVSSCHQKDK